MNIESLMKAIKSVETMVIERYNCAWFDGGCYTLASALCELFDARPYHVSRSASHRDHAVAYLKELDLYIDADGFQTRQQLLNKMSELENTHCTVTEPFNDLNKYPIFKDVKRAIINAYRDRESRSTERSTLLA